MSEVNENTTAEEYVTALHIGISYMEDTEARSEMIDHLNAMKDQLQFLEDSYELSPYEANRRL